jgi:hypothetical protein
VRFESSKRRARDTHITGAANRTFTCRVEADRHAGNAKPARRNAITVQWVQRYIDIAQLTRSTIFVTVTQPVGASARAASRMYAEIDIANRVYHFVHRQRWLVLHAM